MGKLALAPGASSRCGYSTSAEVRGDLVFAGYGISSKELGVDDYEKLAVKGKIAVVRRFVPEGDEWTARDAQRRYGDIRYKAWTAREKGAGAHRGRRSARRPKMPRRTGRRPTRRLSRRSGRELR